VFWIFNGENVSRLRKGVGSQPSALNSKGIQEA